MNIRKDDTVIVLSGDDKGVKGKVIAVSPKEDKVIVEKVNMIHKHVKPRKQGEAGGNRQGPAQGFARHAPQAVPSRQRNRASKGEKGRHDTGVQVKLRIFDPKPRFFRVK